MTGLVMRSTGSFYDVLSDDGNMYNCKVRGKIRLEGIKETNPVAVGDRVEFDASLQIGAITAILPRQNHILRQSVKKTGHVHVLAANVDQVLIVATLAFPRTSLGFIDRVLVTAEAFGIPQIVLFNKSDLLDDESKKLQNDISKRYQDIGVRSYEVSVLTDDLKDILALFEGKITLVAGHSGVGKSTLLNKLSPDINQKIGEVSDFTMKGTHTTTFAEMFKINDRSFIIDTPGIKEWGLIDMTEQEISDYFPEMREIRHQCKFGSRCIHVNEPKCAVIDAIEKGKIAISRYQSYLGMLSKEDNRR
jgi:ribosome biogenesis GTPase / thiamine phosphate phosphatase